MKAFLRLWFLALALVTLPTFGYADSPVTSTPFANAYLDYPMVNTAKATGQVTEDIASYLKDPSNALDLKAAVINALYQQTTWDTRQQAEVYAKLAYQQPLLNLDLEQLPGDQLLVVGYLTLLDNYLEPAKALPYLEMAKSKLPQSFTAAMLLTLAQAQADLLNTEGQISQLTGSVLMDQSLTLDMKIEAKNIITDYLALYGEPINTNQVKEQSLLANKLFWPQVKVNVYFNGNKLAFDVPPVYDSETNRTMVPFRKIFEALGAGVWYDQTNATVCGQKADLLIKLPLGQPKAFINGQETALDAATSIVEHRTMVPLRFVSQSLGYEVTPIRGLTTLNIFINNN